MNNKKKTLWLTITGIALALVVSIGIGYAFYQAQIGSGAKTNVNVTSDTTDRLTFTKGDDINLKATQFNFTNGGTNLSSETTSSATLKANSTNNTANSTYNIYFDIPSNNYVYSSGTTPEIILTITDPTGAAVTSISGLTYVTSGDVSGFDITTKTGTFTIAEDYAITTTSSTTGTTQNWKAKVTYINLPVDQSVNEEHGMTANLLVQKDKLTSALSVTSGDITIDYEKNLIPIMYTETCSNTSLKDSTNGCWVKADSTNKDTTYGWFDYSNHKWANAITLKSDKLSTYQSSAVGTPIDNVDVMGYFVYIPRYSYKLFNVNNDGGAYSTEQEILINFENKNTTKSTGSTNGTYLTHPAFTFGTTELNGFWIGKFETSYGADNTSTVTSATALAAGVTVKPSTSTQTMYSLRNMNVSNLYTTMKSLSNGGGQAASNHNLSSLESSMLTNMQWGAAAYLTESVYGTCTGTKGSAVCTAQPQINSVGNTSTYGAEQTGCGPQSAGSTSSGTTCNYYNTTLGKLASTTQNIYGVYDMNGGAFEYTMGVTYNTAGTAPYYSYSGFAAGTMPDAKYYDIYTYGTTSNDAAAYIRGKLGDATKEVVKASGSTWYGSNAYFPDDGASWFGRGGFFDVGSHAGVLFFLNSNGDANFFFSGRSVLH